MTSEQENVLHEAGIDPTDAMYAVFDLVFGVGNRCDAVGKRIEDVAAKIERRERREAAMSTIGAFRPGLRLLGSLGGLALLVVILAVAGAYYEGTRSDPFGSNLAAACGPDGPAVSTVGGRRQCLVWLDPEKK